MTTLVARRSKNEDAPMQYHKIDAAQVNHFKQQGAESQKFVADRSRLEKQGAAQNLAAGSGKPGAGGRAGGPKAPLKLDMPKSGSGSSPSLLGAAQEHRPVGAAPKSPATRRSEARRLGRHEGGAAAAGSKPKVGVGTGGRTELPKSAAAARSQAARARDPPCPPAGSSTVRLPNGGSAGGPGIGGPAEDRDAARWRPSAARSAAPTGGSGAEGAGSGQEPTGGSPAAGSHPPAAATRSRPPAAARKPPSGSSKEKDKGGRELR